MCFSLEASFIGGTVISAIGIATIQKVRKPSQIVFACIPLFFGVQQIMEGMLWLTMPYPDYHLSQKIFAYLFLIMADVMWPLIIPFSMLFMEKDKQRLRIIWGLLGLGFVSSLYYTFCLVFYHITPEANCYHIKYANDFPKMPDTYVFFIYLIASIVPLFVSSVKRMWVLGLLMFLSCAVTVVFYREFLASVWCFFAASISVVVYWIVARK